MERSILALGLALTAAFPASAARPPAPVLEEPVLVTQVESHIEIGPDGRLVGYEPMTVLKEPLAGRVRAMAQTFRFEPVLVDGRPVIARTGMRLTLAARELDAGRVQIAVDKVTFPQGATREPTQTDSGITITTRTKGAPSYPGSAVALGVSGRVMVAVRLDTDGRVVDAVARQSALYAVKGRPQRLEALAAAFEDSAIRAIRKWRFDVRIPDGVTPEASDLTGLVPVEYTVDDFPLPRPGVWRHEIRSVARPLPWLEPAVADALPGVSDVSGADPLGTAAPRYRLLTPTEGVLL
jgi:hypothetical protein